MKRIVIVCFIMVGIIATGVGSLVHLIRVSDEMDQMLSEVAQAIDRMGRRRSTLPKSTACAS